MRLSKLILLSILSVFIFACGGSGGSSNGSANDEGSKRVQKESVEPDAYGALIDSAVIGISYRSGDHFGVTDSDGRFGYLQGETIQFFVGDIAIGAAVEPLERLTPYELAEGDLDIAMNIARFLQSLDDDGDPSNGILIIDSVNERAEGRSMSFEGSEWSGLDICFKPSEGIQGLVYDLTAGTSLGSRCLISAVTAFYHYSDVIVEDMTEIERQIESLAVVTPCVEDLDCDVLELDGISYCGGEFNFAYSMADISNELLNELIESRENLVDTYIGLQKAAGAHIPTTGVCLKPMSRSVCNSDQKCEMD